MSHVCCNNVPLVLLLNLNLIKFCHKISKRLYNPHIDVAVRLEYKAGWVDLARVTESLDSDFCFHISSSSLVAESWGLFVGLQKA
ncbi:hypothetical protein Tsubulata_018782 [Turnera subulata]|uniref:Uncharacterized protein n=1 Tax=Turnera subulata TaxID=218843 RepID=A0A9Q0J9Y9_9ROSI|nr:hypothetical protein Tsubulata_018782 [Turnera subulata]